MSSPEQREQEERGEVNIEEIERRRYKYRPTDEPVWFRVVKLLDEERTQGASYRLERKGVTKWIPIGDWRPTLRTAWSLIRTQKGFVRAKS